MTARFSIERPPIPRDAITDTLTADDPPRSVATVPIGHAESWIAGAFYERDRIADWIETNDGHGAYVSVDALIAFMGLAE